MSDFDTLKFRKVAQEALPPAALLIRNRIIGVEDVGDYLVKNDKTLVTDTDKRSEEISRPIILAGFPELGLKQEETKGLFGNPDSKIKLYHDPLDGTGGFLMGAPTPTQILAAYDTEKKKVLAVATMEPSTGAFFFSARGEGAYMSRFNYNTNHFNSEDGVPIKVNPQQGLKGGHVLVDVDHSFIRESITGEKRSILSPQGRRHLSDEIEAAEAKPASFYTNGGHYAYVATGRPTLKGCITTAIGGPYDVAGLLHVTEAGGAANCYRIDSQRNLRCLDGNDIEAADIVIAANTKENLFALENIVSTATLL